MHIQNKDTYKKQLMECGLEKAVNSTIQLGRLSLCVIPMTGLIIIFTFYPITCRGLSESHLTPIHNFHLVLWPSI